MSNFSEAIRLEALLVFTGMIPQERMVLRLFSGDASGEPKEIAGFGYAPAVLDSWFVSGSRLSHPAVVFRFTGEAGRVAGYYLTGERTKSIKRIESFPDGEFIIRNNGDEIRITPSLG